MENFTYEAKGENGKYETYEWDNVWIEHAGDLSLNRILYIGDSISCASRRVATDIAKGEFYFDGFGTSKALDNPYFKDSIKLFSVQEIRRDIVIFNNGLHGWHLNDETEYGCFYEEMIKFLLTEFENTPIAIVLTTHVRNEEREHRVIRRNTVANEIANKYGLPVIDLYTSALESDKLLLSDGVHFTDEGYKLLAEKIVHSISEKFPDIV